MKDYRVFAWAGGGVTAKYEPVNYPRLPYERESSTFDSACDLNLGRFNLLTLNSPEKCGSNADGMATWVRPAGRCDTVWKHITGSEYQEV